MLRIGILVALFAGLSLTAHAWAPQPHESSVGLAGSPYFKVRLATARALTGRDDPDSIRLLQQLTHDHHALVRLVALHGLNLSGGSAADGAITRARVDPVAAVRRYALTH